jgi:type I restriction enzyme S subunit
VVGRVGALCGNVHVIVGLAWVTDNALHVKRIKGLDANFLALQLRACHLNRLANANAQPLITGEIVKQQRVVKPLLRDQRQIVHAVREESGRRDKTIATTAGEISLLREYRTRLIADVVTGKLDVREAAARLPDEVDESGESVKMDDVEADDDADEADAFDEAAEEAEA